MHVLEGLHRLLFCILRHTQAVTARPDLHRIAVCTLMRTWCSCRLCWRQRFQ